MKNSNNNIKEILKVLHFIDSLKLEIKLNDMYKLSSFNNSSKFEKFKIKMVHLEDALKQPIRKFSY